MSAGIPDPINYAAAGADAALALAEAVERAPLTPDRDPAFYALLAIWLLFPLHAPLTLWVLDAPFGKFAWKGGVKRLNLPGNLAWVLMEIVAVG
jgi:3-oxo-5-alpha-steroid 4-dehydrogenase 1